MNAPQLDRNVRRIGRMSIQCAPILWYWRMVIIGAGIITPTIAWAAPGHAAVATILNALALVWASLYAYGLKRSIHQERRHIIYQIRRQLQVCQENEKTPDVERE